MLQARLKTILAVITTLITLLIMGTAWAFYSFEDDLNKKLDSKKFIQSTEFYSKPLSFHSGQLFPKDQTLNELKRKEYRERQSQQSLQARDYKFLNGEACVTESALPTEPALAADQVAALQCLLFKTENETLQSVLYDQNGLILKTNAPLAQFEPELFAQYVGSAPIMQETLSLSQIPPSCLNAVLAIEDSDFLDHKGFSWTGLARAFVKNLTRGKNAQGGSTITQQLVKNYFLTNEKTYKRKFQELILSVLLESKYTKDQILELYLNIIYMGQNGSFQVIGFPAASRYYFQKEIGSLNIAECSLLAAVLNGPGPYDPFRRAEKALGRRQLVIKKLNEQNYISETEMNEALAQALPSQPAKMASETAPYFIDAVRKQLKQLNIPVEGSKIYTSLDLKSQQIAQESISSHLQNLESKQKALKANKEKGLSLEGVVLSVDSQTGLIDVAVGGRSYRMTQFNRAVDSQRQIGSIMKPFVYLTALTHPQSDGAPWTAISPIEDVRKEYKYDKQKWSPENYSKKYYGNVPLFFALKNSLNASTANLAMQIGLDPIIETARALGFQSKMQAVPSLSLGAFEMKPLEVLTAYSAISRLGQKINLSFVFEVHGQDGTVIWKHQLEPQQVIDRSAVASLVGMMEQTVQSGSAKFVKASGYTRPTAGKTGTTSDYKDVWFAGFTPLRTSVVWVGYDNNKTTGLTGASGAVPVWISLMKEITPLDPAVDFPWPEDAVVKKIKNSDLASKFETLKTENSIDDQATPNHEFDSSSAENEIQLVFKKGTEP